MTIIGLLLAVVGNGVWLWLYLSAVNDRNSLRDELDALKRAKGVDPDAMIKYYQSALENQRSRSAIITGIAAPASHVNQRDEISAYDIADPSIVEDRNPIWVITK